MPNTYTITVAHPARCLHPNAGRPRRGWVTAEKNKAKRNAFWIACGAYGQDHRDVIPPPRWTRAAVHIRAYFTTNRRRDKDNIVAWLKSTLDGIAATGIVQNDSAFAAPTVEIIVDKHAKPRIEIVVTKGEE